MSLKGTKISLQTGRMNESISFYQNVLGFKLKGKWEDGGEIKWCSLWRDGAEIMLSELNAHMGHAKPAMTGSVYFYSDDIDREWNSVRDKCEIVYGPEKFEYGMKEFGIKDINGYILSFGQHTGDNRSEYEKYFPSTLELDTTRVALRLLREDDYDNLLPLVKSAETWKFFTRDLSVEGQLESWIRQALNDHVFEKRMPFVIIDKDTGEVCGSTSFGNISFFDKRIEIGWTWLGPEYVGMGVNKPAKFTLLSYAFEVMRMERVEAKTDVLNERSKAALLKVGMKPDGVLRNHMQMPENRRRDSIYFSITKEEWPARKESFFVEMI